jgi:hypothetical protein
LYEGGSQAAMLKRAANRVASGLQMAALSIPSFACTPDLLSDLMAAALGRQDIGQWAAGEIVTAR